MNAKALQKQLIAAVAMLLVAAIALGSSTYAWFVNNNVVTAQTLTANATTGTSLWIKDASTAWGTSVALSTDSVTMTPVSTTVKASTTSSTLNFFKMSDEAQTWQQKGTALLATKFIAAANTDYFHHQVSIRAGQPCNLGLDKSTTLTLGNDPLAKGMRVALVVTPTRSNGETVETPTIKYYLYQLDDVLSAAGTGNTTWISTEVASANGIDTAISATTPATATITADNVTVAGEKNTIKVFDSSKTAVTGQGKLVPAASKDGADSLYSFTKADDECSVDIYVWYEGCDFDCTAAVSQAFTETANTFSFAFTGMATA